MLRCVVLITFLQLLFVLGSSCFENSSNSENVSPNYDDRNVDTVETCNTKQCQDDASALLGAMDKSIDPCHNFYNYACGNWITKNPIPENSPSWYTFEAIRQQDATNISKILTIEERSDPLPVQNARDFYSACKNINKRNENGLQPLLNLLESFGGWPMTHEQDSDFKPLTFSWQHVMASITRDYGTPTSQNPFGAGLLLNVYNRIDEKNTDRNLIYIDQPYFILGRQELINHEAAKKNIDAYKNYIRGAAKIIKIALKKTDNAAEIDNQVAAMLDFESKLANITTPQENRRDRNRMYNLMSLTELQNLTDIANEEKNNHINWFNALRDIYIMAGIEIKMNEIVIVRELDYLQKLIVLLSKTPSKTIANYVLWQFIYRLVETTNEEMRNLQFEFEKIIFNKNKPTPLEDTCTNMVKTLFDFAIGYKYIPSLIDQQGKDEIMKMASNVQEATKSLIDKASWLDLETKQQAKEKVTQMVGNVGYPDWMIDRVQLEQYYSGLSISTTDFFESYTNAYKLYNTHKFKDLHTKSDRNKWYGNPNDVNAHYDEVKNKFIMPSGMLQPPFYKHGRMAVLNYGAYGTTIGHEIIHGLDDQGSQFDKFGNLKNWWSDATRNEYDNRAKCFVDQYGNYSLSDNTPLNGKTTLGENIANDGAIKAAYHAYKQYVEVNKVIEQKLPGLENYSSDQLFFLSHAIQWCGSMKIEFAKSLVLKKSHIPFEFSINGPLSNNADFIRTFECSAESNMNRLNKCVLW